MAQIPMTAHRKRGRKVMGMGMDTIFNLIGLGYQCKECRVRKRDLFCIVYRYVVIRVMI